MSRKGGLGKSFSGIMAQTAQGNDHPLLSALAFIHSTDTTGGGTMNAVTGHVIQPHEPGYIVGGEPDTKGRPVPSGSTPAKQMTVGNVLSERTRVRQATGRRANANLGSWEARGRVVTDASGTYEKESSAQRLGYDRREEAIWDNAKMREIDMPYHGFLPKRTESSPAASQAAPEAPSEGFNPGKGSGRVTNLAGSPMERWQRLSAVTGRDPRTLKKR